MNDHFTKLVVVRDSDEFMKPVPVWANEYTVYEADLKLNMFCYSDCAPNEVLVLAMKLDWCIMCFIKLTDIGLGERLSMPFLVIVCVFVLLLLIPDIY